MASKSFFRFLKKLPNNLEALSNKGISFQRLKKVEEVTKYYVQSLAIKSHLPLKTTMRFIKIPKSMLKRLSYRNPLFCIHLRFVLNHIFSTFLLFSDCQLSNKVHALARKLLEGALKLEPETSRPSEASLIPKKKPKASFALLSWKASCPGFSLVLEIDKFQNSIRKPWHMLISTNSKSFHHAEEKKKGRILTNRLLRHWDRLLLVARWWDRERNILEKWKKKEVKTRILKKFR